jgi:hypothetical protein
LPFYCHHLNKKPLRITRAFPYIPTDIDGSIDPKSLPYRHSFHITFIGDHTHFSFVYTLKRKSDAFVKFLEFSAFVRIQFHTEIEVIGSDGEENILMATFEI